jgi:hypothetical protein
VWLPLLFSHRAVRVQPLSEVSSQEEANPPLAKSVIPKMVTMTVRKKERMEG